YARSSIKRRQRRSLSIRIEFHRLGVLAHPKALKPDVGPSRNGAAQQFEASLTRLECKYPSFLEVPKQRQRVVSPVCPHIEQNRAWRKSQRQYPDQTVFSAGVNANRPKIHAIKRDRKNSVPEVLQHPGSHQVLNLPHLRRHVELGLRIAEIG